MTRCFFALVIVMMATVALAAASVAPLNYWHSVLPNTPIPSVMLQRLSEDKQMDVDSGLWGVGVAVGRPGVAVTVGTPGNGVNVFVDPFSYQYPARETQLKDNAGMALFFLEKDLFPGSRLNLHFTKTMSDAAFLPRSVADSLPFSSAKLADILIGLSIKPHSEKAIIISKTLQTCEQLALEGEIRYCATSLESMVDFTTASLGSHDLLALSTEVSNPNPPKQAYTIAPSGVKKLGGSNTVACHAQLYPYAVYYCHATRSTKSYVVSLIGNDGTKVQAVVVCHKDTSRWNPKHIAFQLLKVSPGKVPVCHFLPPDHIIWARRA